MRERTLYQPNLIFLFFLFATAFHFNGLVGQCTEGQTFQTTSYYSTSIGQTFTPACSGDLSNISVQYGGFGQLNNGTLHILSGEGCDGTVIYSQNGIFLNPYGVTTINITGLVTLSANAKYSFIFVGSTPFSLRVTTGNPYPNGNSYESCNISAVYDLFFVVNISAGPLPVELSYFSASANENSVSLEWHTVSESNNEGFEIEHSRDGVQWRKIGFIPGHGTTIQPQRYRYQHDLPVRGVNYYRLRQVDFDGQFEYSEIVTVSFSDKNSGVTISPNPAEGAFFITAEALYQQELHIAIYNKAGQLVLEHQLLLKEGINRRRIDISQLYSGIYIINFKMEKKQWQERVVKL